MNKCAFTRYRKKYPYLIVIVSGSLHIPYTSIHIHKRSNPHSYMYPSLFIFESESESDGNIKTNTISIVSICIRSVYVPISIHRRSLLAGGRQPTVKRLVPQSTAQVIAAKNGTCSAAQRYASSNQHGEYNLSRKRDKKITVVEGRLKVIS
jgi:hypothetical protein